MRRSALALLILLAAAVAAPSPLWAGWDDGQAAYAHDDWAVAARELEPLARQGDPRAQARYGRMLLDGLGVPKNEAEGIRLLQSAADHNDPEGQARLAGALETGRGGLPRDVGRAAALLQQAADQNHPLALHNLGTLYIAGLGVPRDPARGIDLLRRAADLGMAISFEQLGRLYWYGSPGIARDHVQALAWVRKAADAGLPWSQNIMGVALFNGDGMPRDQTAALSWFRRAATKRLAAAEFNLGEAYRGGVGVERDQVEAYAWFLLAADNALPAEKTKFERARDNAALLLAPSEAERARQIAAAYSSGHEPPPAPRAITPPPAQRVLGTAGSGFFVSRDGMVLTNNHVVPACRVVRVTPSTAVIAAEASVVARDSVNDLALLRTSLSPAAVVRFREDKPMRAGDGVVAVGYPLSSLLSREPNVTAGVISAMAGARGDVRFFQLTAPVQKGNSGGPLADMSGNVVGVVSRKLDAMAVQRQFDDMPENVNFAIKEQYVRRFLADSGVTAETAPASETLSAADVGDRIKKAAVFIECLQ